MGPKLVILGAPSADNALSEAVSARKLCPDSKIILLHEFLSPADFQKLLTSEINDCVPLFASPDTLISMLDMIVTRDVCAMVVGDAKCPVIKLQSDRADHEDVPVSIGALQHIQPLANGANVSDSNVNNGRAQCVPLLRAHPELTERKAQILDGLVKGQANKVIARTWEITEATVKVHMKSILRKIRIENRTQAAIWAMANGYAAYGSNGCRLNPDSARNAAAITEATIRSVATNRGPFSEYTGMNVRRSSCTLHSQLLFDLLLLPNSSSQKSVQDFVSLRPAIASDQDLTFARRTSSLLTVVGYHCLP